jgi:hypothetical protein
MNLGIIRSSRKWTVLTLSMLSMKLPDSIIRMQHPALSIVEFSLSGGYLNRTPAI